MFLIWLGILICLIHSAMFSGLNIGFFGLSRLRLEVQAEAGNDDAKRILKLRQDSHLLLATLLWGNVSCNVLIALLSDSVMAGVGAFIFSTFGITLFGEIFPQAYLARHILRASMILVPIIKFYQILFYPVAKLTAVLLDQWLGKEEITYFQEKEFMIMLKRHAQSDLTDLERLESMGAINFLALDDIKIKDEGETLHPQSIINLPTTAKGLPVFPTFDKEFDDLFLQRVHSSSEKWVIITNESNKPILVLNADQFLRDVMYGKNVKSIYMYCHRPIVVDSPEARLGEIMLKFKIQAEHSEDDVIDHDLILYWNEEKRIITGADILGRLLRGIVKKS